MQMTSDARHKFTVAYNFPLIGKVDGYESPKIQNLVKIWCTINVKFSVDEHTTVSLSHAKFSVCRELRENGRTDQLGCRLLCDVDSGGSKEACIRWGCTLTQPGEYDWTVHVRRRCGLLDELIIRQSEDVYCKSLDPQKTFHGILRRTTSSRWNSARGICITPRVDRFWRYAYVMMCFRARYLFGVAMRLLLIYRVKSPKKPFCGRE